MKRTQKNSQAGRTLGCTTIEENRKQNRRTAHKTAQALSFLLSGLSTFEFTVAPSRCQGAAKDGGVDEQSKGS
jgi:hypothetical protein